ncbi:MAG: response regulator transcription factor [Bacteroidia bacterium]|nr:response regulator transcription factor [Bacteroidia bacterium]MBP7261707.1 response regulator transcription factor [Bacteroidia bacterium]MBP9724288.1 response regulator transcription factor [Bacteroidia bacterium]
MNKIRIAIVDDHKIFRQGVKSVLQPVKDFEVVLEVSNGQDLLNQFSEVLPDVVLMDIKMAGMDGIATTRQLMQTYLQAKVIGLSVFDQEIYISSMFEAGAKGYLLKDAEPEEIVYAINKVHEGDYHFKGRLSNILYEKLFHQLNKTDEQITLPLAVLSPAEVDILKLICAEQTNKEISENLNMSVKTVENFRNKLLSKTGSKNVVGLVTFAIKKGYLIVE